MWASRNNRWWSHLLYNYHRLQKNISFTKGQLLRTESASRRSFQILLEWPKNCRWKNNDKVARRLLCVWTIKIAGLALLSNFKTDNSLRVNWESMLTSTSPWTECQINPKLVQSRRISQLKISTRNAIQWSTTKAACQARMISSICVSIQALLLCERNPPPLILVTNCIVTRHQSGQLDNNNRLEAGALRKLKTQLAGVHRQAWIVKLWACSRVDCSRIRENKRSRHHLQPEWHNWVTKSNNKS